MLLRLHCFQSVLLEDRVRAFVFQWRRHSSQSSIVIFSIALADLCSHRPFLVARSRLIFGIARGEPKCMLAASQPMSYSNCDSSFGIINDASSMREQSGAR